MKFLFRTDVHAADKSPSSWKGDYQAEIWSSLDQVGKLAKKYNVKAVLDGGDYFHVKSGSRNSHSLVATSADIHAAYPCPIYMNPGNHDITHNNLESLEQQQPLRVLFSSSVFRRLVDVTFEESDVGKVRVLGFPYDFRRSLEDFRGVSRGDEDWLICVVHALASEDPPPNVEEFMGEPVFRYSDLVFEGGPDLYLFGHWHKDQGVSKIGSVLFANPGSLSRGSLVKENITRIPQVVLIEIPKLTEKKGLQLGCIPLQVKPALEVFDLEKKERREKEGEAISQFVERLRQDASFLEGSTDIQASISSLNFAKDVQELAISYLERARG